MTSNAYGMWRLWFCVVLFWCVCHVSCDKLYVELLHVVLVSPGPGLVRHSAYYHIAWQIGLVKVFCSYICLVSVILAVLFCVWQSVFETCTRLLERCASENELPTTSRMVVAGDLSRINCQCCVLHVWNQHTAKDVCIRSCWQATHCCSQPAAAISAT